MYKTILALLLIGSIGCSNKSSVSSLTTDTTQKVQLASGAAVDTVAGNKELLRQTLILADSKGTLEGALAEAAQDPIVGPKMRTALGVGAAAKKETMPAPRGPVRHAGSGNSSTSQNGNGDALDKANQSLDKANQEVNKGGQAVSKANDLGRKVGTILNGGH